MKKFKNPVNLSLLAILGTSFVLMLVFQNCSPARAPSSDSDSVISGNLLLSSSTLPSPTFTFVLADPNNYLGTRRTLFLANAKAAAKLWAKEINSSASIQIKLEVADTFSNRGGGESVMKKYVGTYSGHYVAEEGAVYELRTGTDPNGTDPDISIIIDPNYLNNELWLDPNPDYRTNAVPYNKIDAVSVFLHEMGHALGFNGYWSGNKPPVDNWIGVYDKFITVDASGNAWFTGANAKKAYGGRNIPLCKAVIYHYGDISTAATDGLAYNLMTGNYFMYGRRYTVQAIDRAFLRDIGLPLK